MRSKSCKLHVVRTSVCNTLKRCVMLCAGAVCVARLLYVARCTLYAVRFVQQRCTLYVARWPGTSRQSRCGIFYCVLHPPHTRTCGVVRYRVVYISSVVPYRAGSFPTAVGRRCTRYQYLIVAVGENKPTFCFLCVAQS